ncbi:MAG: septum formation initiator family protein [Lawsonella clevelandensis]
MAQFSSESSTQYRRHRCGDRACNLPSDAAAHVLPTAHRKEALQAENAQLVEEIKRKEEQLAVQNDPKMIEEQARQRLLLIPRGETGFRVILPGKEQDENVQQHVDDVPNLSLNGGGPRT